MSTSSTSSSTSDGGFSSRLQKKISSLRQSGSGTINKPEWMRRISRNQSSGGSETGASANSPPVSLPPSFFISDIVAETESSTIAEISVSAPSEPGKIELAARIARMTYKFRSMLWHGEEYFKDARNAPNFKRLLIESGPVFIKLGQWMVQRPDVFPADFLKHLESLQRDAPTHSFAETRRVVEAAVLRHGDTFDTAFSEFDIKPLASGSIAQVHCAVWHGKRVVVKVRHPNITALVQSDLAVLKALVRAGSQANNHYCRAIDVERIMREMMAQCDMSHEKRCLESMRHNFASNPLIHFPEPYFATQDILIESFVDGVDYRCLGDSQYDSFVYKDAAEIAHARNLCKQATMAAFLQMILNDSLLHADLHGGNILYRIERYGEAPNQRLRPHVTFLDFGMILHLNEVQVDAIHQLIVGLYAVHADTVVDALAKVAMQNNDVNKDRFDAFARDCTVFIKDIDARRISNGALHVPTIMTDLLKMLHRHRLLIDGNMVRIMVDFVLISEGRENLEYDNLTDDTIEWVLYEPDGDYFPIIDHVMQIPMALEKRDSAAKNNASGSDGGGSSGGKSYCSTSIQSISASKQREYAAVETLSSAIALRGAAAQESGAVMNKTQRAKQKKQRERIADDAADET